ncbi:MAG: AAA family ATPase [Firmicutes bacterium]|nr:AAA family ATPase [Bacillota bacterium]
MPLLSSIRINGLLSFGDNGVEVALGGLNVLIGPNGSGKSNLIEVFGLLQAIPNDILIPIRQGWGINEWLWKGSKKNDHASIETVIGYPDGIMPLRYKISIGAKGQTMEIIEENLSNEKPLHGYNEPYLFLDVKNSRGVLNKKPSKKSVENYNYRQERRLRPEDLDPNQSVLAQRRDPDQYPEITYLGKKFSQIKIYREWNFGRFTAPRLPQKTDLPEDFLLEDASNLGLVLNDLQHRGSMKPKSIVSHLREFYENAERITVKIHGGTVHLYLHEKGYIEPIPATRLSDGTLRFLCLLAILCHPSPPPLICLEEPELGLHPDIIPTVADMLVEAANRTQLIVTTHSDILIDALTTYPETVIVCEKGETGTEMRRLEAKTLQKWLKSYSLGELWRKGEIGGTRW